MEHYIQRIEPNVWTLALYKDITSKPLITLLVVKCKKSRQFATTGDGRMFPTLPSVIKAMEEKFGSEQDQRLYPVSPVAE